MLQRFHSSIVLRSTLLVLLLSSLVGYLLLAVITNQVEPRVQKSLNDRLVELVKTVENTAKIASFLGDRSLADEVAKGLLMNGDVKRVIITNENGVLTDLDRTSLTRQDPATPAAPGQPPSPAATHPATLPDSGYPPDATIRTLYSPFKQDTPVGKIIVLRNQASINHQVSEAMDYIRLILILQTAAIIIVVGLIAIGYIGHPIHQISKRLDTMSAIDGEKLAFPQGHQNTEIGHMVRDINALTDRLVQGLMSERELRQQREIEEKRFRTIFENAETGLFIIDRHGTLESHNPAFCRLICQHECNPQDTNCIDHTPLPDMLGTQADRIRALIDTCLAERHTCESELILSENESNPRWVSIILTPTEDDRIQGVINDITETKQREAHANKLALTDPLTGLGNRLGFDRQIDQLIQACKDDPDRHFTLMMIDLDRFKAVNDTHGHDAGDAILIHVARHIEQSIRKSDFAARLGGDEFVVLLPFIAQKTVAERLAKTLISNITRPVTLPNGQQTSVGASIGVALASESGVKKAQIIKQADLALYAVKEAGRNDYRIFDGSEDAEKTHRPSEGLARS